MVRPRRPHNPQEPRGAAPAPDVCTVPAVQPVLPAAPLYEPEREQRRGQGSRGQGSSGASLPGLWATRSNAAVPRSGAFPGCFSSRGLSAGPGRARLSAASRRCGWTSAAGPREMGAVCVVGGPSLPSPPQRLLSAGLKFVGLQKNILWPVKGGRVSLRFSTRRGLGLGRPWETTRCPRAAAGRLRDARLSAQGRVSREASVPALRPSFSRAPLA